MVSSRRRPGVFLLAIATMMFSLVLLPATSSGAQTESEDQGNSANAAVGDEECVEFEDEDGDTSQQDDNEGSDTLQSPQDAVDGEADQETQGDDQGMQDQNENGDLQAQDGDEGDNILESQQDDVEDEGDQQASQDVNEEDNGLQDLQDGGDGTTSSQAEGAEDEECVVADTVPDESLLPTGAPASSSRPDEKTAEKKKKSDRGQGQESRKGTTQEETTNGQTRKKSNSTGKQQKAANTEAQKKASGGTQKKTNSSETQSKSGSGGTTQGKSNGSETRQTSDLGETVRIRGMEVEVDDRAGKVPRQEELKTRAQSAAASDLAPRLAATEWTRPSREEVASTGKPRNFAPNPNAGMTLSARALGLYDIPVTSSDQREDLDNGLVHVPETSRPGDEGGQKNVFIAGHYLGVPQTPSRLAFYNLHKLKSGDELVLEDGQGQAHKYRVSEKFAVGPGDSWTMGEVRDRDMVTLQTCIPPDFGKRLMVRADRVRA
jgi:sortase A